MENLTRNRLDRLVPLRTIEWLVLLTLGFVVKPLGDRAWWVIPPLAFAFLLVSVKMQGRPDGKPPVTSKRVLFAATMMVAVGAFLKFV
jgi:hypothetical protein